jgi:uncharacterized iron-regulated membrane protein
VIRKTIFWIHLACGAAAGLVILVMAATGTALMYQRQMQYWADTRHFGFEPAPDQARAPAARLIEAAELADPSETPATALAYRRHPAAPAEVTIGRRTIYVNPYTAAVYGEGTGTRVRAVFAAITSWHRYLAQAGAHRDRGRAVTGGANLLFLALVLSGMYLWWPSSLTWTRVRQVVWLRRRLPSKARHFNWHNTLGFWSALPLAFIVSSGVVLSYPWASNLVYRVMGEAPPPPGRPRAAGPPRTPPAGPRMTERAGDIDLDTLLEGAMAVRPDWTILTLRLPVSRSAPAVLTVDEGTGGQPQYRGTLTVASSTGAVLEWEGFSSQTPGRRARSWLRFIHTGEAGGLAGQTLAGLASFAAVILVYTGLSLAWKWTSEVFLRKA